MDHPLKSPIILSLCPGIRGLERGLERAIGPVRVAAYVEIEAFICANLVAQMESGFLDPVPIWTDIKTFNAEPFRNKLHWIIGGYPCQPFSHAGKRGGLDDPRHLWPYIREIVRVTRPVGCFFENVRGHLSMGYDIVQRELNNLGYAVESGIFSAKEVGSPQRRERLFILAIQREILVNSNYGRSEQRNSEIRKIQQSYSRGSNGLAYTNGDGHRARTGSSNGQSSSIESKTQWQKWNEAFGQWMWNEFGNSSAEKLVYPGSERSQRSEQHRASHEENKSRQSRSSISKPSGSSWPARPGQQQYEWEKPRTIEPRLGCTVDGYNFREDLLRALGNSVVEQTAELAFNTLMKKHFNHD